DAIRAVQQEKNIHPFQWPQPLQACNSEYQGGHDYDTDSQRHPTPPTADLHVAFPAKPNYPRQYREQEQQVKRMSELEAHGCLEKIQAPSSKIQRRSKTQDPSSCR